MYCESSSEIGDSSSTSESESESVHSVVARKGEEGGFVKSKQRVRGEGVSRSESTSRLRRWKGSPRFT